MIENVSLGLLILGCVWMSVRAVRWANKAEPQPWERV